MRSLTRFLGLLCLLASALRLLLMLLVVLDPANPCMNVAQRLGDYTALQGYAKQTLQLLHLAATASEQALIAQNNKLSAEISKLIAENSKLREQISDERDSSSKCIAENCSLLARNSRLSGEKSQLTDRNVERAAKIAELEQEAREVQSSMTLQKQLLALMANFATCSGEVQFNLAQLHDTACDGSRYLYGDPKESVVKLGPLQFHWLYNVKKLKVTNGYSRTWYTNMLQLEFDLCTAPHNWKTLVRSGRFQCTLSSNVCATGSDVSDKWSNPVSCIIDLSNMKQNGSNATVVAFGDSFTGTDHSRHYSDADYRSSMGIQELRNTFGCDCRFKWELICSIQLIN